MTKNHIDCTVSQLKPSILHFMRAGQGIIVISIALLMLGVVMVNSAGMRISHENPLELSDLITSRPSILAGFAIVAMFLGSRVKPRLLTKKLFAQPVPILLLAMSILLLLAVYLPGFGKEVNYSHRWIAIGGLTFQPSEIAKWVVIVAVAFWATTHTETMKQYWRGFIPPIACIGVICAIIAVEDLGTAVLIFLIACLLFFAAGTRMLHFASLIPVALSGFILAVIAQPYRIGRLQAYLHPFENPEKTGYHILQSMNSIAAGGLSGLGLGNGVHKFGYLPEDTTDFIFSVICEELGIFGAIAVTSLYVGLFILGIAVIRKARNSFDQLLTLGIMATVGLQAGMNILVVTAMIPTKGIALPLVSNGGTGWLLTAFCIGLVYSIDRENHSVKNQPLQQIPKSIPSHA